LNNSVALPFARLYAGPPLVALFAFSLFLVSVSVQAREATEWLDLMAEAIETRNYEGTLVYMQPGLAETFHVYHRVADGEATERVVAMDGDGAEIIRTSDEVICIFPGQQKVVVEKRQDAGGKENPLRANLPQISPELQQSYDLLVSGGDRIIGKSAIVVSIGPKDSFRYGYRIWLDEESAMPLKVQLLDQDESMPVEELFFTSISMPDVLSEAMIKPALNTDEYSWVRHGKESHHEAAPVEPARWFAADLPAGFMQTAVTLEYMADSDMPRTHLVYSDGLASVSVFIDVDASTQEQVDGFMSMGAANSYTRTLDGMLVTAMGEVPARTVQKIAISMEMPAAVPSVENQAPKPPL